MVLSWNYPFAEVWEDIIANNVKDSGLNNI